MKMKELDCVRMMHECAAKVRERLKGMTLEEEAAYWRQRTEEMRRRKRELEEVPKAS